MDLVSMFIVIEFQNKSKRSSQQTYIHYIIMIQAIVLHVWFLLEPDVLETWEELSSK